MSEYLKILRRNALNSDFLFRRLKQVESMYEEDVLCGVCGKPLLDNHDIICQNCKEKFSEHEYITLKRGLR